MQFETAFHTTGDRPTVFVIEADQVVRSALHFILRDRHRAVAFTTPGEARASAEPPDVILLGEAILRDLGDSVLTELGERFPSAGILLVVDQPSNILARASLDRGVNGIVSKPISFDSVCDAVNTALSAPGVSGKPSHLIRAAFG